jgi:hypothetical protein
MKWPALVMMVFGGKEDDQEQAVWWHSPAVAMMLCFHSGAANREKDRMICELLVGSDWKETENVVRARLGHQQVAAV